MSDRIDQIFDAYEQGTLSRRDVLAAIASFVAGGALGCASDAPAQTADSEAPAFEIPPPVLRAKGEGRAHLNHVNLRVADVARSHAFYQRFFGLGLVETPTYNALDCGGGTFMSLQTQADIALESFRTVPEAREWARTPNEPAGILEHFCLEVDDFDLEETKDELLAAGHEAVVVYDNLLTADPDGILVQIVDSGTVFYHESAEE